MKTALTVIAYIASILAAAAVTFTGNFTGNGVNVTNITGNETIIDAVRDYGADNTGVSDSTIALQNAITAATGNTSASTTAIIYLRAGTYLITNTLTVPLKSDPAAKSSLTIMGPPENANFIGSLTSGAIASSGAIIKLNTTNKIPILTSASTSVFNRVMPVLQYLTFVTPTNGWSQGIDLAWFASCRAENVGVTVNIGPRSMTTAPNTGTRGIVAPAVNDANFTLFNRIDINGYDHGFTSGEHTRVTDLSIAACNSAIYCTFSYHPADFRNMVIQDCAYAIEMSNSVSLYANFTGLDIENDTGAPAWEQRVADVLDPGNGLHATISYLIITEGTGATNAFIKSGGANVNAIPVGSVNAASATSGITTNFYIAYSGITNMLKFTNGVLQSYSSTSPSLPNVTNSLVASYDANSVSGTVSTWPDLWTNGYNLLSSGSPTVSTGIINNNNAVVFSGTQWFSNIAYQVDQPHEAIFVALVTNVTANMGFMDGTNGSGSATGRNIFFFLSPSEDLRISAGTGLSASTAGPFLKWCIFDATFNGASSSAFTNGVLAISGNAGSENMRGLAIGRNVSAGENLRGLITRVDTYSTNLTTAQKDSLYAWYTNRYGMTGVTMP